jgi:tetratricopeptide (TPR) repeat protein
LRAQALTHAGSLAGSQGDFQQARALQEKSLALSRECGDWRMIAVALSSLASVATMQGDDERARSLTEEQLALWRKFGTDAANPGLLRIEARMLMSRACAHSRARARSLLEESIALDHQRGRQGGASPGIHLLGILAYQEGKYAESRVLLEQSLAAHRELGSKLRPVYPLIHLAHAVCRLEEYPEAYALLAEALVLCREAGDKRLIVECLEGFADIASGQAQPERAARLYGAAEAIREAIAFRWSPVDREEYDRQVAGLRGALGEAAFAAAWNAGRGLTWRQAADYALSQEAVKG